MVCCFFNLLFLCFTRYLGRSKSEQTVLVRPPFLRPEISDSQIAVKIMDNGIQAELKRTKVRPYGAVSGSGFPKYPPSVVAEV